MRNLIALSVLAFICITLNTNMSAQSMLPGKSDKCGPIGGTTQEDLRNLKTFCETGMPAAGVVSAAASGPQVWIEVTREIADSMRADRLTAKQLILNWMKGWKEVIGKRFVIVYVLWGEGEIAKGDTTIFSGNVVTIH